MSEERFYVYVYIDPRNNEEFYYGKGTGSRKLAHLYDEQISEKTETIKAIRKEGLEPIIKVIASNLSSDEAHLIETTLIWKLGRNLTNKVAGKHSDIFRPHNTLHKNLPGFDFQNDIFLFNVGEGPNRTWEDCRAFGFMAAGQHPKWSNQLKRLNIGDVIIPYIAGYGYVGVGKVTSLPVKILDFKVNGKSLNSYPLKAQLPFENAENENSEYLVGIEWIVTLDKSQAHWKTKSGLFTTQLVCASLQGQPNTIKFLEDKFGMSFDEILENETIKIKKAS